MAETSLSPSKPSHDPGPGSGQGGMGQRRRRSWLGRLVRALAILLAIVVLLLGIVVGGAVWRIAEGPLSLKPVLPLVNFWIDLPGEDSRFAADDIIVEWLGRQNGLSARATRLRLQGQAGSGLRVDDAEARLGPELILAGIQSAIGLDLSSWFPANDPLTGGPVTGHAAFWLKTGRGELTFISAGTAADSRVFQALEVKGHVEQAPRQWQISDAVVDFGNTRVSAQATLTPSGRGVLVTGSVTAGETSLENAIALWPAFLAPGGRTWVARNMSDGVVRDFALEFSGRMPRDGPGAGRLDVETLKGRFDLDAVTVHYLRPMPSIRNVVATATFDNEKFAFVIASGTADHFKVTQARVDIYDLGQSPEMIEIEVTTDGPIDAALTLLEHPVLGLLSSVGLAGKPVRGMHESRFLFRFPLIASLRFRDVHIEAEATASDFGMSTLFRGQGVSRGLLNIGYRNRQLIVTGTAETAGVPLRFEWNQTGEGGNRRHEVTGRLTLDERLIEVLDLGLDGMMTPPVPTRFKYVSGSSEASRVTVEMDLEPAELELAPIGWHKAAGRPGKASLTAILDRDSNVTEIEEIEVDAANLKISGRLTYGANGQSIDRFEIKRFELDDTALAATIVPDGDDGLKIDFRADVIDVSALRTLTGAGNGETGPLELRGKIDELRLAQGLTFRDAEMALSRDRRGWARLRASAGVRDGQQEVFLTVTRSADGYEMELRANDLGALLSSLDLNDSMREGSLVVTARSTGPWSNPWDGVIRVRNFRMVGITGPSRLLALVSWQGIQDALRGQGVSFTRLDAPFRLENDVMTITDARAIGSELGLIGNGAVDLDRRHIDLEGMMAPAYTINNLVGRIPVIGRIITGSEGGGLVALNYKVEGSFDDTRVSVDPLSILQLGIVRDIFGRLFRSEKDRTGTGTPSRNPSGE